MRPTVTLKFEVDLKYMETMQPTQVLQSLRVVLACPVTAASVDELMAYWVLTLVDVY